MSIVTWPIPDWSAVAVDTTKTAHDDLVLNEVGALVDIDVG